MKRILINIFLVSLLASMFSCRYYRGHIMFQTEETIIADSLAVLSVEENYKLKPGDRFTLKVSGSNGEMIIDPDNFMKMELGMGRNQMGQQELEYFILSDGKAKLPVVGFQDLAGKTVNEATMLLQEQFGKQYPDPFVNITLLNRRVVVFGASGGQVINLENENMNLLEVLAISKELNNRSYADNIRLIRGDLQNPNVQIIDLTTIEGMKKANLGLRPNDIIYVEPKQVLAGQALRENVLPYVTVLTALTQSVLLYLSLTKN